MRESDRLASEALNPMPEHLVREIEAHAGAAGDLQTVPSELARQIEAHKKETKVGLSYTSPPLPQLGNRI